LVAAAAQVGRPPRPFAFVDTSRITRAIKTGYPPRLLAKRQKAEVVAAACAQMMKPFAQALASLLRCYERRVLAVFVNYMNVRSRKYRYDFQVWAYLCQKAGEVHHQAVASLVTRKV